MHKEMCNGKVSQKEVFDFSKDYLEYEPLKENSPKSFFLPIVGFADFESLLVPTTSKHQVRCGCKENFSNCICKFSYTTDLQNHYALCFSLEFVTAAGELITDLIPNMRRYIGPSAAVEFLLRLRDIAQEFVKLGKNISVLLLVLIKKNYIVLKKCVIDY